MSSVDHGQYCPFGKLGQLFCMYDGVASHVSIVTSANVMLAGFILHVQPQLYVPFPHSSCPTGILACDWPRHRARA
jgi:hypothetical protein